MTNIKAEIIKVLKREGVQEAYVHPKRSPYHSQVFQKSDLDSAENNEFVAECVHYIDAAYVAKLESLVLELGEVAEAAKWYRENSEPTFFELAGGDGAPSGYLPYQGNWDKLDEALAKLTAKLQNLGACDEKVR